MKAILGIATFFCLGALISSVIASPWPDLKCNHFTCYNTKVVKPAPDDAISEEMGYVEEAYLMQSPFDSKQELFVSINIEGSDTVYGCFYFYNRQSKKLGKLLGCIEMGNTGKKLYLRGGKNIYTEQGVFNKQSWHKYQLSKKAGVKEVKQPFMYLGLKTKVALPPPEYCGPYKGPKALTLYQKKSLQSERVAVLPLGYEIEVLLQEENWYLIKSSFGLVGWAKNMSDYHSLFGVPEYHCVG